MPISEVHWISSASISGDKCIRQANDVEENPGPTIFDIIDPTNTVSADSMSLNQLELALKNTTFKSRTPVSMYQFDPF